MREQCVRLEHHTDITLLDGTVCDIFAVNEHLTFGRFSSPATRRSTVVSRNRTGRIG